MRTRSLNITRLQFLTYTIYIEAATNVMIGLIDDIDANGELYVCAWGRTSGQVAMVMISWW